MAGRYPIPSIAKTTLLEDEGIGSSSKGQFLVQDNYEVVAPKPKKKLFAILISASDGDNVEDESGVSIKKLISDDEDDEFEEEKDIISDTPVRRELHYAAFSYILEPDQEGPIDRGEIAGWSPNYHRDDEDDKEESYVDVQEVDGLTAAACPPEGIKAKRKKKRRTRTRYIIPLRFKAALSRKRIRATKTI